MPTEDTPLEIRRQGVYLAPGAQTTGPRVEMVLMALAGGVVVFGLLALYRPARAWVVLFACTVAGTFVTAGVQWEPAAGPASASTPVGASLAQVLALVKASADVAAVPADIDVAPSVAAAQPLSEWGGTSGTTCFPPVDSATVGPCVFGDPTGARTIVLYGDSHVQMWFHAIDTLAIHDKWRLVILSKGGCPASSLVGRNGRLAVTPQAGAACRDWHTYAANRINRIHPDLLVVSQSVYKRPDGSSFSPQQWNLALAGTLRRLHAGRTVVLGDIPYSFGPRCLLTKTVKACATSPDGPGAPFKAAERAAARTAGATYLDVTPWFCAAACSPIIGHFDVYIDNTHVAIGYTEYLERVLGQSLQI